jgi:selenium binding protein SBP56
MSDRDMQPTASSYKRAGVLSMVEVSRDGKRVYFTNPLYGVLNERFYPDGVGAWMTKLDAADGGGIGFDHRFCLEGDAFRGRRTHQVRLEGGTPPATPTATRDRAGQTPQLTASRQPASRRGDIRRPVMPAARDTGTQAGAEARPAQVSGWRRRLCVGSLWLPDSVLQVQVFMFSRGFATGLTSAHNVHICTARVLTGSMLMPAQIGG